MVRSTGKGVVSRNRLIIVMTGALFIGLLWRQPPALQPLQPPQPPQPPQVGPTETGSPFTPPPPTALPDFAMAPSAVDQELASWESLVKASMVARTSLSTAAAIPGGPGAEAPPFSESSAQRLSPPPPPPPHPRPKRVPVRVETTAPSAVTAFNLRNETVATMLSAVLKPGLRGGRPREDKAVLNTAKGFQQRQAASPTVETAPFARTALRPVALSTPLER